MYINMYGICGKLKELLFNAPGRDALMESGSDPQRGPGRSLCAVSGATGSGDIYIYMYYPVIFQNAFNARVRATQGNQAVGITIWLYNQIVMAPGFHFLRRTPDAGDGNTL